MNTTTTKLALAAAFATLLAPAAAVGKTYPKVGAKHDRVVELVSVPEKLVGAGTPALSSDGNRILYSLSGGGDQTTHGSFNGFLLATRTAAGWSSANPMPPRSLLRGEVLTMTNVTADLSSFLFRTTPPFGEGLERPLTAYRYQSGVFHEGYTTPLGAYAPVVTSPDLRRAIGPSKMPLVAEDTAPNGGLYDFGAGHPELIGLLPDGSAPTCGVSYLGYEFAPLTYTSSWQNWISGDAERVFFHTRGSGDCGADPANLYMRQGGVDGTTTLISGPRTSGADEGARFSAATPDGTQVFFTTSTKLDPADANASVDVYRHTPDRGNECLTCLVPDAEVISPAVPWGEAERVAVSQDGERVYFSSFKALRPGATAGQANLYVWRAGGAGDIAFVASLGQLLLSFTGIDPSGITTPDGRVLAFFAKQPELNALTNSDNGGFLQLYRYDDRDGSLVCVSCRPGGAEGAAAQLFAYGAPYARGATAALTPDGRMIVFKTDDALVPEDDNQRDDVYEWRDGEVGLITAGTQQSGTLAGQSVYGLSPDGRDLLFGSNADLAPGVIDGSAKLYDARIGGGFGPSPASEKRCDGDSCQGQSTVVRTGLGLASAAPGGGGDLVRQSASGSSARITVVKAQVVSKTAARLLVRASRRGTLTASGLHLTTTSKRVSNPGTVTITVVLNKRGRSALTRKGSLKAKVKVLFKQRGGRSSSTGVSLTFKEAHR